jgi:carbamoyltransferase
MTINFNCKNNLFPAITHVDNTCRIQTVNSGTLFDILNLFNERNNCPILLNTSFNLAGEPLVQTIKDALSTFNKSSLDAVFFVKEKRLIVK